MKIRMKVYISGTRNGQNWPNAGEEIDVPDAEGADLCAGGFAEPVTKRAKVEKAVDERPAETRSGLTTDKGPRRRASGAKTAKG